MLIEPPILNGDDRLTHYWCDINERHLDAILFVNRRDYGSVRRNYSSALRQWWRREMVRK